MEQLQFAHGIFYFPFDALVHSDMSMEKLLSLVLQQCRDSLTLVLVFSPDSSLIHGTNGDSGNGQLGGPLKLLTILRSLYQISLALTQMPRPLFDFTILLYPYCGHDPIHSLSSSLEVLFVAKSQSHWASDLNAMRRRHGLVSLETVVLENETSDACQQQTNGLSSDQQLSLPLSSSSSSSLLSLPLPFQSSQLYHFIALGGTFDRLHSGHKFLLSAACLYSSSKILVGVSSEWDSGLFVSWKRQM